MVAFKLSQDQVKDWFPTTYQYFIDELRNSKSSSNDIPEEKIEWCLSWGFFVKKATSEEEAIAKQENFMNKLGFVYEDRVQLEIPRIRCSVNMKAGYYYKMDRVSESDPPQFVQDMAKEIIKFMMVREQQFIGNSEVLDSLKEFGEMMILNENHDQTPLTMDDILDKINEKGMSSLSSRELEYLESMSKGK